MPFQFKPTCKGLPVCNTKNNKYYLWWRLPWQIVFWLYSNSNLTCWGPFKMTYTCKCTQNSYMEIIIVVYTVKWHQRPTEQLNVLLTHQWCHTAASGRTSGRNFIRLYIIALNVSRLKFSKHVTLFFVFFKKSLLHINVSTNVNPHSTG